MNKNDIINHIDSIINGVKNNAKIIFSTKDENTFHYNIICIMDYKFILKCEKRMMVNDYHVIIEKEDKEVINYHLPFFIGKMLKSKIADNTTENVDRKYVTEMLEKAKSFFSSKSDGDDDIKNFKDL